MKELGENLEPGQGALILLIRKMTPDKLLSEIKNPGKVIQSSLDTETEERLSTALASAK
jgi:uncharacterized membrane protein